MFKRCIAVAALLLVAGTAQAQSSNPIADGLLAELGSHQKNMVASAEQMPEDKYAYRPTPPQITFGDVMAHAAMANNLLCALLAGDKPPEAPVKGSGPKQALVDQLKQSFAYCEKAIPKLDPATLTQEVPFLGRKVTKGFVAVHTSLDWGDHYAMVAMYLRLNGLVPPSAQKPPAPPAE